MSESKQQWTPGPWSYDRGIIPPDGPGRYSTVSADGDVVVAEINDLIPEGIANAKLIAAAPELVEAAKIGLQYIEAVCFNTPNPKKRANYADAASKIRAALAKAGA
ncbi:hypothetical protein [Burkholderia gladioli]|uniref:hypothetical protein n=1 Tax=Burkholderia gladioli TaxID=28095 RepID=UPI0016400C67|nr:hypothetical protein [Burkholderia gladioli]